MNNFAAVILAAGYSSRMKAFKPLLPIGEKSVLEHLLDSVKAAGIRRIVVVTGHNREALQPVLEREAFRGSMGVRIVEEAYNAAYDRGMFSSIQTGLQHVRAAAPDVPGVFLIPADCPLISHRVLQQLMEQSLQHGSEDGGGISSNPEHFYVPTFEGKKGHPLLIPMKYVDEICSYEEAGGLKAITDQHWEEMIRVPVDEEGCILDMDTPEEYEEICDFLTDGCRRESLQKLAVGKRLFLVRHGETKRHAEKMFIGRYDVPLAEDAAPAIAKTAMEIADALSETNPEGRQTESASLPRSRRLALYTSPLKRAQQTAQIMKAVLEDRLQGDVQVQIQQVEDLQEISLGDWDGRAISEIKEKFPDEYRRRGENIFVFKTGNKAENFYDVQYRTVKALRKILKEDDSRDIIFVSHSAVIRALENNLKGLRVDDPWTEVRKGSVVVVEI